MTDTPAPRFTVYTLPICVQCNATKREITKQGGEYDEVDLSQNEEALEEFKSIGHAQAPVVVGPDDTVWSGFRLDLIRAYFPRKEPK